MFSVIACLTVTCGQLPPVPMGWEKALPRIDVRRLATADKEEPCVELVCFGDRTCAPCQLMKRRLGTLRARGWSVWYNDVDQTPSNRWTDYHKRVGKPRPHMVIWIDDEPWEQTTGEKPIGWIEDWLNRAANAWRVDHGIEPVPFKAYGDTVLTDEHDREFFYEEHWRMTRGTCGMMGCTAHGGMVKVREKVPVERSAAPSFQPAIRGSGGG